MENVMLNLNKTLNFTKETNIQKSLNSVKDFSSTLDSVKNHQTEDNSKKVSEPKKNHISEDIKKTKTSEKEYLEIEEIEETEIKNELSQFDLALLNIPVAMQVENVEAVKVEDITIDVELLKVSETDNLIEDTLLHDEMGKVNIEETVFNIPKVDEEVNNKMDIELKDLLPKEIELEEEKISVISNSEKAFDKNLVSTNEDEIRSKDIKVNNQSSIADESEDIINMSFANINEKLNTKLSDDDEDTNSENEFDQTSVLGSNNLLQSNKLSKNDFQVASKAEQPIEPKEVIKQIVQSVKLNVSDLKNEIKLDLKPEALGKMAMTIEVIKGEVTAKIMVDNYRTKEIIEANLTQLKEGAKENNLEIKTVEVYVGNNNDFDKHSSENFNSNQSNKKIKIKPQNMKIANNYDEQTIDKRLNDNGTYNENGLNLFA